MTLSAFDMILRQLAGLSENVALPTTLGRDRLLRRGVEHLSHSEYKSAIAAFAKVEDLRPQDTLRVWRAKSYAHVATRHRYGLFPDGRGATALDIDQQHDAVAYGERIVPQLDQLRWRLERKGEPIALEHALIDRWLTSLLSMRSIVDKTQRDSAEMRPKLLEQALSLIQLPAQVTHMHRELLPIGDLLSADLCHRAGNWQHAQHYLQAAQRHYQAVNDEMGIAACELAALDFQLAPLSTPLVWNCAIVEGSATSELAWEIEAQEVRASSQNLALLQPHYQRLLDLFERRGATAEAGAVMLRLAFIAWLQGAYAEVRQWLAAAETVLHSDPAMLQTIKMQRALVAIAAGEMPERRDLAQEVGAWGKENGAFSFTLGLGIFCLRIGRYWLTREGASEKALAAFRLSEHLFRALDAPIALARALTDRATVYQFLGENNSAGQLYGEATTLLEGQLPGNAETGNPLAYRILHLSTEMLELYTAARNPEQIERLATRLRQLDARRGSSYAAASNVGTAFLSEIWRRVQADETTNDAAVHQVASWSHLWIALEGAEFNAPLYRAKRAERVGDRETAHRYYQEALQIVQQAQGSDSRMRAIREASIYGSLRQYDQAERIFRAAVPLSADDDPLVAAMRRLGMGGQYDQLMQSRNLSLHQQAAIFFTRIKRFAAAYEQFQTIERIAGVDWWQRERRPWETLLDYAEMCEGLTQYDDALHYYDLAIEAVEQRRATLSRDELKVALMGSLTVSLIYLGAARTALRVVALRPDQRYHYLTQSLRYAELGKGRALQDLVDASVNSAGGQQIAQDSRVAAWREATMVVATWRGLLQRAIEAEDNERASVLRQQVQSAESKRQQLEQSLAADNPAFYQLINPQSHPLSLAEMQSQLDDDTLLVEYMFHDETLLIWAISRQEAAGQVLSSDTFKLNGQVQRFYALCSDPATSVSEIRQLGKTIAAVLLDPIKTQLVRYQHIMIVPHGSTHRLPFHALTWQGGWLAATHLVSYRPNASSLRVGKARRISAETPALIVGNPINMSVPHILNAERIPARRLPGASQEAMLIAQSFPNSQPLIGSDATEAAVRQQLGSARLIHLATHGYLSPEFPLLSSILLANGDALTVTELAGIELNADLVVLSACSTGIGEQTSGDEIIGLTRGLLGAGARSAIVTLWPVSDRTTMTVMLNFYNALLDEASTLSALQTAQREQWSLKTLRQTEVRLRDAQRGTSKGVVPDHPFFWAAFYFVG